MYDEGELGVKSAYLAPYLGAWASPPRARKVHIITRATYTPLHIATRCALPHALKTYFQNIAMDWKSDPLDLAGGPLPKATPQTSRTDLFFGVALRYRHKRELHKESRVTWYLYHA